MSEKVAAVFHLGVIGWGRCLGLNRGGGKRVLSPRRVPLAVGAQLQHPDPARRQLGDEGLEMGPVLHVHVPHPGAPRVRSALSPTPRTPLAGSSEMRVWKWDQSSTCTSPPPGAAQSGAKPISW